LGALVAFFVRCLTDHFMSGFPISSRVGFLVWTLIAVLLRRQVAVHRETGRMNLRRRPKLGHAALPTAPAPGAVPQLALAPAGQGASVDAVEGDGPQVA